MQKSIFTRVLSLTMGIVVLSFIMLGGVMTAFFGQYWQTEKKELLTQNANSISKMSSVFAIMHFVLVAIIHKLVVGLLIVESNDRSVKYHVVTPCCVRRCCSLDYRYIIPWNRVIVNPFFSKV